MPKQQTPAEVARVFVSVFHDSPRAREILDSFLKRLGETQGWTAADVAATRRLILNRMPQLDDGEK